MIKRFPLFLFVLLPLLSCGTERDTSSSDDQTIASDVGAAEVDEFSQKVTGTWATTSEIADESIEGCSFKPSSSGLTGTLGYFVSDASGEVAYELISKRSFHHDGKQWVGWIVQDHFFENRQMYYIVCHDDLDKPEEIYFYRYSFNSPEVLLFARSEKNAAFCK